eukprot:CAMPEP_0172165518 /NCGR_PEP_ID=MMETSP1050-20130122/8457_1 /TAXON_ID=233186 /ORGANISM="Cryptomonas curvata, Strain CCAP979/52" /LENGTH=98 /DNA_ID=CAMNT_0012835999 /DNA_START=457 /DNA_END=750 /DNA_ORIENTATION=+
MPCYACSNNGRACGTLGSAADAAPAAASAAASPLAAVSFVWARVQALRLVVTAPFTKAYVWTASHTGWLVLHYTLRLEPQRRACCATGVATCCGGVPT